MDDLINSLKAQAIDSLDSRESGIKSAIKETLKAKLQHIIREAVNEAVNEAVTEAMEESIEAVTNDTFLKHSSGFSVDTKQTADLVTGTKVEGLGPVGAATVFAIGGGKNEKKVSLEQLTSTSVAILTLPSRTSTWTS